MKILMVLAALIGPCLLAWHVHAQSVPEQKSAPGIYMPKAHFRSVYCRSVGVGDLRDVQGCLSDLEGTLEKVFDGVESLKSDVVLDEFLASKTTDVQISLQDRLKELENTVHAQGILLDTQHQQIEDLQKQIDIIRAPVKKPKAP